jgi:hypothetical protein
MSIFFKVRAASRDRDRCVRLCLASMSAEPPTAGHTQ